MNFVVFRVAHVMVEVSVMDLNDNPPMFVNQPYYAVVSKEAARDSQGMQMETV
jgi:protocadherin Fat 1/2/3